MKVKIFNWDIEKWENSDIDIDSIEDFEQYFIALTNPKNSWCVIDEEIGGNCDWDDDNDAILIYNKEDLDLACEYLTESEIDFELRLYAQVNIPDSKRFL